MVRLLVCLITYLNGVHAQGAVVSVSPLRHLSTILCQSGVLAIF
jgi:hypothetical protein